MDEVIARVLRDWRTKETGSEKSSEIPVVYPSSAVEAVEFIERILQVSQDDVLTAAKVSPRTYFGWKSEGRRPQARSLGRLWPTVHVLSRLEAIHPNVAYWFHSNSEARRIFLSGDLNGLIAAELSSREVPSRSFAFEPADDVFEDKEPPKTTLRKRVSQPLSSVGLPQRRSREDDSEGD